MSKVAILHEPVLTDVDRASAPIQKLRIHLLERLESARIRNESAQMDPTQTAAIRGEIRQIRYMLSLFDEPIVIPSDR